jgi:molybdopterin converting factor small subunit
MPKVCVPPPYRGPTKGEAEVDVAGRTILECIEAVDTRYPGFRAQVLDPAGKVHRFVRLFLNGEALEPTALDRSVADRDEVGVLAAIAGG